MKPIQRLGVLGLALLIGVMGCSNRDRNMAITAMNHGIEQYQRGNASSAIARLEEATRIDPGFGEPHLYLGMIRLKEFDSPEQAIFNLQQAIERMGRDARPHYYLGEAYWAMGQTQQAESALRQAIELDDKYQEAWYRLGSLLEEQGDIMGAVDAYTRAIYADPRQPLAYTALGDIYLRYNHPPEAIAVFLNGFQNCGDASNANALGGAYLVVGEVQSAIEYFERAVELEPRSTVFRFNLGAAYAQSYRSTHDERERGLAIRNLEVVNARCGRLGSQARCNSVRVLLEELAQPRP
ncbi:MAG: tetratricopeptide repeat protein [Bradymonadales bacterium]|nr:tetratricopeptide repeat protein [Bradymonadales bacterium]